MFEQTSKGNAPHTLPKVNEPQANDKPETKWTDEGFLEINEPYESDEEEIEAQPTQSIAPVQKAE